jgi:hypothetical protein
MSKADFAVFIFDTTVKSLFYAPLRIQTIFQFTGKKDV